VLGVNTNTVPRALRQLRDEGLLEFRRGHGITVTGAAPRKSVVLTKAQELIQVARREGYRRDELLKLIQSLP
jgi:GntR family transcriptional regulator